MIKKPRVSGKMETNGRHNNITQIIITFTLITGLSFFIRMLGPTIGFALVSIFLKMYIDPTLTPIIDDKDPRWLGAWWIGWIICGLLIMLFGSLLCLLPKTLPRAAARKELMRQKSDKVMLNESDQPSFKGWIKKCIILRTV